MGLFWTCFSAYCFGWFVCNIFAWQLADRVRDNPERQRKFAAKMAEEYYRLAHPESAVMPDNVEEMMGDDEYRNV